MWNTTIIERSKVLRGSYPLSLNRYKNTEIKGKSLKLQYRILCGVFQRFFRLKILEAEFNRRQFVLTNSENVISGMHAFFLYYEKFHATRLKCEAVTEQYFVTQIC